LAAVEEEVVDTLPLAQANVAVLVVVVVVVTV